LSEVTTVASQKISRVKDDPLVLVVDDDPDMLALLSAWFEQADLRVMTAASGAQAEAHQ